jgi:hypothetical protein
MLMAGCADAEGDSDAGANAAAKLGLDATDETGVVAGIVADLALHPIAGVHVALPETGGSTMTDEAGLFGFEGLPAGVYVVEASKAGWNATRVPVEVLAGVSQPDALVIRMSPDPSTTPYILYSHSVLNLDAAVYVVGSTFTAGGFTGNTSFEAAFELASGASWFQNELVWEPQTELADDVRLFCGVYVEGASEYTLYNETFGKSPLTLGFEVPPGTGVDRGYCWARLADEDGLVGATADQRVDLFTSLFHHMRPNEGWTLVEDGEHPAPP